MKCPKCEGTKTSVMETTKWEDKVYRRRTCNLCYHNFKSLEVQFTGAIPQKPYKERTNKPEPKEFQKSYDSKSLQHLWK